jgi:hypothetical protein
MSALETLLMTELETEGGVTPLRPDPNTQSGNGSQAS